MKPQWFLNLRVATEATTRGPSGTSIMVMAHLLRAVHGICAKNGIVFAAAFPDARHGNKFHPGTILRAFLETRDEGDTLYDALAENDFLAGYITLDRVRPVPEGLTSSSSFQQIRIPSESRLKPEYRLKRMQRAEAMPFLNIRSSTGNDFNLIFKPVRRNTPASDACEPNGYGMSVSSREFFLPDLPTDGLPWARKPLHAEHA